MTDFRKQPTKSSIADSLRRGKLTLPPISFALVESGSAIRNKYRLDTLVEGRWGESSVTFAAEVKTLSTPKAFTAGIALLKTAGLPRSRPPLLIAPYFSEAQLQQLEREGVNGVDLCGNGVINIAPRLTVFRTGQPNRFPSYAPIKNIYRRNSSLVGRLFLTSPEFSSVKQIVEGVVRRDPFSPALGLPSITVGTVSKVLAGMEQDLIIERSAGTIALLQPDALLEKLSRNYADTAGPPVSLKVNLSDRDLLDFLAATADKIKAPIVATGLSSVNRYAVMQREEKLAVCCPRPEELLEELDAISSVTSRFPNLEIFSAQDPTVCFDAREEDGFFWASPVQTYLELMAGDKRDQETACQVRTLLLSTVGGGRA